MPMDAAFHAVPMAAVDITDLSRFAERKNLCRQYSLSPVKNLSVVLLTPAITFFSGVVDTGQK